MKKVIFTVLTGGYDNLIDPDAVSDGWEYICFTDNPNLKSNVWDIVQMENTNNLSAYKLARLYKINPHPHLLGYDRSIHVDCNAKILCDLNMLESEIIDTTVDINLAKHRMRDCLYDEAAACIQFNRGNKANIINQVTSYNNEGMPKNFGLYSCGFQYRNLKSENLRKFSEEWVETILKYSVRDQISFPYVLWKNNTISINSLNWNTIYTKYFNLKTHLKHG
jgi:hypothetical protein